MPETPNPWWLNIISGSCFLAFTIVAFVGGSQWRRGFLFIISGLFGFILKYGPFGFTCSFRSMLSSGNFSQTRDMLIMIFFATCFVGFFQLPIDSFGNFPLFFPEKHHKPLSLAKEKVGLSIALGSFMFGMGMQLGSGCATGTLVGMAEGSLKSWVVIIFFITGATIGATPPFYNWWSNLPATNKPVILPYWAVLLILIALIALTFLGDMIRIWRNNRSQKFGFKLLSLELIDQKAEEDSQNEVKQKMIRKIVHDIFVDFCLAVCVGLFFICDGQVIGVMGVFPSIGGAFLRACGVNVEKWDYYQQRNIPSNFLDADMFVSDLFINFGAFLAATVRRNFAWGQKKTWGEYVKGVCGGLLMGLGGRMSAGCNIGSMLSGITSGSFHGFLWMICAIFGSWVVVFGQSLYDKFQQRKAYVDI